MLNIEEIIDVTRNVSSGYLLNIFKTLEDMDNVVKKLAPNVCYKELNILTELKHKDNEYLKAINYISTVLKQKLNKDSTIEEYFDALIDVIKNSSYTASHIFDSLNIKIFYEDLASEYIRSLEFDEFCEKTKESFFTKIVNSRQQVSPTNSYCSTFDPRQRSSC